MKILALDLGTRAGWALWDGERRESGVQVFDVKRGESPGMRYVRFNRWLDDVARPGKPIRMHLSSKHQAAIERESGPELIVYEQTHNRGGAATEVAAGFATRVQEFAATHGMEHAAVHSSTLKKWTVGSGRAAKEEMVVAVLDRFFPRNASGEFEPATLDDNEADAVALLEYARAELVPAEAER